MLCTPHENTLFFKSKKQHQSPVLAFIANSNASLLLTTCVHAVLEQIQQFIIVDNVSLNSNLTELLNRFPAGNCLLLITVGYNSVSPPDVTSL